jgi:hypothetical protein
MPDGAEFFGEMAGNLRSSQGKQRLSGGSVFEGTGRVIRPLARAGRSTQAETTTRATGFRGESTETMDPFAMGVANG